jgi:NAD-dependent deacetylase
VVWFGEGISEQALRVATDATAACDVFLCIGTSAVVQPASRLPLIAKRMGAKVIEINTEQTAISVMAHWSLLGKAGDLLPTLVRDAGFPTTAIDGAKQ